jgi:hypothetical protein
VKDQPGGTLLYEFYVRADGPTAPDWARVMNWAENLLPQIFPAQGKQQMAITPYQVRYYPGSGTYLGYNPNDKRFYGYNPALWGPNIVGFGVLGDYLPGAQASGF